MKTGDVIKLFQAIDRFDSDAFITYLSDNAVFRFANMPAIEGKQNIFTFLKNFFSSIKAIRHDELEVWECGGIMVMNGRVSYTRHDDSELSVPFSNTFKLDGEKIKDYLIFVDTSELYR